MQALSTSLSLGPPLLCFLLFADYYADREGEGTRSAYSPNLRTFASDPRKRGPAPHSHRLQPLERSELGDSAYSERDILLYGDGGT